MMECIVNYVQMQFICYIEEVNARAGVICIVFYRVL